ncbi:histone deacetylase family protein [Archaeoglobales archaeon]|nr:MAG: histone deacetylase family protein [Archaeoglobales archaeon]
MKIVFHPRFYEVYTNDPAAESGRMESIVAELTDFEFVEAEMAKEEDILLVHTQAHYDYVKSMPKIFELAMLAAGGAIKAAEISFEELTFAAIRPPGHHASPDSCWGFCYFNNVAIAVKRLIEDELIGKAVIVDFDLHFGDGTANTFKNDSKVVYHHMQSVERLTTFLVERDYDIIAVSAGFDRHKKDWGGMLETEDYKRIGEIIAKHADKKCDGKCFAVLEGGYNHSVLGKNVRAFVDGLASIYR